MSANTIHFDKTTGEWNLNGQIAIDRNHAFMASNLEQGSKDNALRVATCMNDSDFAPLTDRSLGELIGAAIGSGITWLEFNTCTLTVEYIRKALAFKARNGWFVDFVDDTSDHKFDQNNPTPGGSYNEGRKLLAEARELEEYARLAGAAHREDEATSANAQAAALREQAHELLFAVR